MIKWYHIILSILNPISIKYTSKIGLEKHMYFRKRIFHKGYTILDYVCISNNTCFFVEEMSIDSLSVLDNLKLNKD